MRANRRLAGKPMITPMAITRQVSRSTETSNRCGCAPSASAANEPRPLQCHQAGRAQARVAAQQVQQAARKQHGADQQPQRNADLCDDRPCRSRDCGPAALRPVACSFKAGAMLNPRSRKSSYGVSQPPVESAGSRRSNPSMRCCERSRPQLPRQAPAGRSPSSTAGLTGRARRPRPGARRSRAGAKSPGQ